MQIMKFWSMKDKNKDTNLPVLLPQPHRPQQTPLYLSDILYGVEHHGAHVIGKAPKNHMVISVWHQENRN